MGPDIIEDSGQAEEKKQTFFGKLLTSFTDSLSLAPIGPAVLDTVEAPQTEAQNYTPLYIIAALAIAGAIFFAVKTGKK